MRLRSRKLGEPARRGIDGDRLPAVLDDALDDDEELLLLRLDRLFERLRELYDELRELRDERLDLEWERDLQFIGN